MRARRPFLLAMSPLTGSTTIASSTAATGAELSVAARRPTSVSVSVKVAAPARAAPAWPGSSRLRQRTSRRRAAGLATGALGLALAGSLTAPVGAASAAIRALVFPANAAGGATATGVAEPHRCSPITERAITGTLLGADGRGLNATIGFDVLDAHGRKIDVATGCPSGGAYGAIVQLNHWVSGAGARVGSRMHDSGGRDHGAVDPRFQVLRLPANASRVFVETYTRAYHGNNSLGEAGSVDTSRYGFVNRHDLTPGGATSGLRLVAPLPQQSGSILVTLTRPARTVYAFSQAPDGVVRSQGWAVGKPVPGSGGRQFLLSALAGGQPYVVDVDNGASVRGGVRVVARSTTRITVAR